MSKVEQWYVDNMKLGSGGLGEGQPSAADFGLTDFWLTDLLFKPPCPSTFDPLYPRLLCTAASQPTVDFGSRLATFGRIVGRKTG